MGLTESQHFVKDFFLSPIPQGDIVIPGIEYDYDKATLRPASMKILDDVVDFLNLNNNLSVEISSHTDSRGADAYNLRLSQERAKSVVDYLIQKGIKSDRLIAQGYGETKLLIPNAQTEEEHQKNRRTAFRPIKEGVIQAK
jgi:outer membrane protein OmpA-like peptidoglycan-associated protein